jgi:hypothetical protein
MAVLVGAQITQLCDHRELGRHFLAIAPNGGSCVTAADQPWSLDVIGMLAR